MLSVCIGVITPKLPFSTSVQHEARCCLSELDVTACMVARQTACDDRAALTEVDLNAFSEFVESFHDDQCDFSLNLPNVSEIDALLHISEAPLDLDEICVPEVTSCEPGTSCRAIDSTAPVAPECPQYLSNSGQDACCHFDPHTNHQNLHLFDYTRYADGVCDLDCNSPDPDCFATGMFKCQSKLEFLERGCLQNSDCQSNMHCQQAVGETSGVCQRSTRVGEDCDSDSTCQTGSICSADSGKCSAITRKRDMCSYLTEILPTAK